MEEKTLKKIGAFLDKWEEKETFKKIDEFHKKRIEKLKKNETPFPEGGKIAIHLIPFESFNSPRHYDLSAYNGNYETLKSIKSFPFDQTYNFDGLLYFIMNANEKCLYYVQIYINGIIEVVDGYHLGAGKKVIYTLDMEKEIMDFTKECLLFQKKLGVNPPIFLCLTLLGAKNFSIPEKEHDPFSKIRPIDREDLLLPKIRIEKFDIIPEKILKANFDRIWNACGHPRCLDYNEKGEFKAK